METIPFNEESLSISKEEEENVTLIYFDPYNENEDLKIRLH
jgi:hypothetical protein